VHRKIKKKKLCTVVEAYLQQILFSGLDRMNLSMNKFPDISNQFNNSFFVTRGHKVMYRLSRHLRVCLGKKKVFSVGLCNYVLPLLDILYFTMYKCELCSQTMNSKYQYNNHQRTNHLLTPKFECPDCHRLYKNKRDIKRHKCKKKEKQDSVPVTTAVATTKFVANGTSQKYTVWLEDRMAASTAKNVSNFNCFLSKDEWLYASLHEMQEKIQYWQTQELGRVNSKTVATNMTSLLWMAKYKNHPIVTWLEVEAKKAHTFATIHNTTQSCLAMLDPYKMTAIRNQVVQALAKYQNQVLDPMILEHLRTNGLQVYQDHSFGLNFMCWLDLVLRFCDVPCRMQVTQDMVLDSEENFVSKLGRDHQGEYYRIVDADKVGKWTQPVKIRVGLVVSAYLWFYLKCVRPFRSNQLSRVFPNQKGGRWNNATGDVKRFLNRLGIAPDKIDPSGRFVHGSRHIGLATFAVQVNFDQNKLRNFAILMRHSLNTSEKVYNIWTKWWHTKNAVNDFRSSIHNEERPQLQNYSPALAKLHTVSVTLYKLAEIEPPTREVGTQTGTVTLAYVNGVCSHQLTLFGPLGLSRDPRFGCYWFQCAICFPKDKRPNQTAVWKPLGWRPPKEVISASTKPRNWDKIIQHWNKCALST
jgi:hypothetical protein